MEDDSGMAGMLEESVYQLHKTMTDHITCDYDKL